MNTTSILTQGAQADLIRIHQRDVRQYGEAQADKYYYDFIERFEQLAEQPYMYQAVDDIREGYRRSVCGVDSIYFSAKPGHPHLIPSLQHSTTFAIVAVFSILKILAY